MSGKKASEIKWCAYCGIQAPSGAAFCPRCGEPLDPSYVYDESISSEEAVVEEGENLRVDEIIPAPRPPAVPEMGTHLLYEGTFRGLVTGESGIIRTLVGETESNIFAPNFYGTAEACFVIKLEEGFEGVPSEILVQTSNFCSFWKGDEVILRGRLFKIVLRQWGRPMYTIFADHFYNESLQFGHADLIGRKKVLYKGMIRGTVTRESKTNFATYFYSSINQEDFTTIYFVMKLEEGFEGVPREILVRSDKEKGYFSKGDKVILQGEVLKQDLKQWSRPMYIIRTEHSYNESLQFGSEGSKERTEVLHKGMIRGLVTREPIIWYGIGIYGTYFSMKLEENIAGVPPEILVFSFGFGYFSIGDKVILQGILVKKDLKQWSRPMYTILARDFYNESLQIGYVELTGKKRELYRGMMRGSVTRESRTLVAADGSFIGTYFAMRLEGNIGIEGIPEEILVRSKRAGYFRIGDKVILQGRIIEGNLRLWNKPMYLIIADHYYNESLQIGD